LFRRVIGEDERELHVRRPVAAGRVEQPRVEEEHVPGLELHGSLGRQDRRILREIGAQELALVEPTGCELHAVRARSTSRQPLSRCSRPSAVHTDTSFRLLEGPVAHVAVPAGHRRESGLLVITQLWCACESATCGPSSCASRPAIAGAAAHSRNAASRAQPAGAA